MKENNERADWNLSDAIWTGSPKSKPVLDDISVVIPTLGRPILEQSLYHILEGSAWPACLIVVDQGTNTDVADWLESVRQTGISVKHIRSSQRGRSAGINRGLEQVATPFVAITDDDCFVGEEWLINMAHRLRLSPRAVVTGRVEAAGESMIIVVTSPTPSTQNRPRLKFDSMSGGNMGASLESFRKVGLFEEDPVMATAEDAEWAYRALRKGISICYEPRVMVSHFGWRDVGKRVEQYRDYALSHGGFYGKYLRRGDLFILARSFIHLVRSFKRWVYGKIVRDSENTLNGKAYFLGLVPGIIAGFRSRHKTGKLL